MRKTSHINKKLNETFIQEFTRVHVPSKKIVSRQERYPNVYERTFDSYEYMIEEFLNSSLFTDNEENPDFWYEEVISYEKCKFPVTFD